MMTAVPTAVGRIMDGAGASRPERRLWGTADGGQRDERDRGAQEVVDGTEGGGGTEGSSATEQRCWEVGATSEGGEGGPKGEMEGMLVIGRREGGRCRRSLSASVESQKNTEKIR